MSQTNSENRSQEIYAALKDFPAPLFHPSSPVLNDGLDPSLQSEIASLLLHPALESAFYLLNHSLSSPHFLVRKMQNSRVGQHLHGILHRIEGDYNNARVWYTEASGLGERTNELTKTEGEDAFVAFWSGVCTDGENKRTEAERARDASLAFLDRVQTLAEQSDGQAQDYGKGTKEREELERISKAELESVVEWAARTYGWGTWNGGDGSAAYTGSTDEQKEEMRQQQFEDGGFRKVHG